MDTQDKNVEPACSEVILPDTDSPLDLLEASINVTASTVAGEVPVTAMPGDQELKKSSTPLQESLRRLRRDKRAMISLGVIVLFILIPILGPPIYQHIGGSYQSTLAGRIGSQVYHNPFHQELDRQDEFISAQYWLGTNPIGRYLLARLIQRLLFSF